MFPFLFYIYLIKMNFKSLLLIFVFQLLFFNKINAQNIDNKQIVIPIIVHVIYNIPSQNITDELILSQIDVLNEDYNAKNCDLFKVPFPFILKIGNPNIQFKLIEIRRVHTKHLGFIYFNGSFQYVKFSKYGGDDVINPETVLNIWVCNLYTHLGYSSFPEENKFVDGVVIGYKNFGRDYNSCSDFNLGRTLTHEVGHWFGLKHLWGNSLDPMFSDDCDDTPPQMFPTRGCLDFPQYDDATCEFPGIMFNNFMDYGNDACAYFFTKGQVKLIRQNILLYRSDFLINQ